jgi:NAD(P)-dependent dehydrogenase (short-subunit alcohol dehydrogenase family)
MRLTGKKALVTGGDQGIGQAIALRLAEEGADIVLNYRKNRDGAEETRQRIEQKGRVAVSLQADVGKIAEVRGLVRQAVASLGSLDILVNNAGIEKNASFFERHRRRLPRGYRSQHERAILCHSGIRPPPPRRQGRRQSNQHQLCSRGTSVPAFHLLLHG